MTIIGKIQKLAVILAAIIFCGGGCSPTEDHPVPPEPPVSTEDTTPPQQETETSIGEMSNESASAVTQKVYDFLVENYGRKILSGAMANVDNNNDFASWVTIQAAKHPAINGYDFIQLDQSRPGGWVDYDNISSALEHWENNGLVSYMWHWRVPLDHDAYIKKDSSRYAFYSSGYSGNTLKTDFDIERALTPGTWENECIMADIDRVAAILGKLRAAGVPVIWRPLHEAAGSYRYSKSWFWWGAKGGKFTIKLWRLLYDRLVRHHKLDNLIWVWTAQHEKGYENNMKEDYPGNDCVDIIGADIYSDKSASHAETYKTLVELGEGKRLVALSETGRLPSPEKCASDKAMWSWFMLWYTFDIHRTQSTKDAFGNTSAEIMSVFGNSHVMNREDLPSFKNL